FCNITIGQLICKLASLASTNVMNGFARIRTVTLGMDSFNLLKERLTNSFILQCKNDRKRNVALANIRSWRFANLLLCSVQIEQIIPNLKCHTNIVTITI